MMPKYESRGTDTGRMTSATTNQSNRPQQALSPMQQPPQILDVILSRFNEASMLLADKISTFRALNNRLVGSEPEGKDGGADPVCATSVTGSLEYHANQYERLLDQLGREIERLGRL